MMLIRIKAMYQKIRQNLIINLDQKKKIRKKRNTFDSVSALYEGRALTLNAFKSGTLPIKGTKDKRLKILTAEQMFQRLPIALAQVKADSTFENLLNEIRQTIYSLHQAKENTKKVYNNKMNSIKV